jgi:hypothetical protein
MEFPNSIESNSKPKFSTFQKMMISNKGASPILNANRRGGRGLFNVLDISIF